MKCHSAKVHVKANPTFFLMLLFTAPPPQMNVKCNSNADKPPLPLGVNGPKECYSGTFSFKPCDTRNIC